MAKQEITPVQVQMAAAAGVKLLQQDDLMVPLSVAKSGALSILEGMLNALANGEVVLTNPPPPENIPQGAPGKPMAPVETPPQEDPPPANDAEGSGNGAEATAEEGDA